MFGLLEGLLLKPCPDPRFSLLSEQVKGSDNIREVWDEFPVKVRKSSEGPNTCD